MRSPAVIDGNSAGEFPSDDAVAAADDAAIGSPAGPVAGRLRVPLLESAGSAVAGMGGAGGLMPDAMPRFGNGNLIRSMRWNSTDHSF